MLKGCFKSAAILGLGAALALPATATHIFFSNVEANGEPVTHALSTDGTYTVSATVGTSGQLAPSSITSGVIRLLFSGSQGQGVGDPFAIYAPFTYEGTVLTVFFAPFDASLLGRGYFRMDIGELVPVGNSNNFRFIEDEGLNYVDPTTGVLYEEFQFSLILPSEVPGPAAALPFALAFLARRRRAR